VMRDRVMVVLDCGFSLELQDRQWMVPPCVRLDRRLFTTAHNSTEPGGCNP
jgi:hypothetical protein